MLQTLNMKQLQSVFSTMVFVSTETVLFELLSVSKYDNNIRINPVCAGNGFVHMQKGWMQASRQVTWRLA